MTEGNRAIAVSHGEPLRSPNVPGLRDPVRQLRDNPVVEAQAAGSLVP